MEIGIKKRSELIKKAIKAKNNAYCPYSKFKVGAAVLTSKGNVYAGCNVENSSYGVSMCAERVAIFNAVTSGDKKIVALCLVSDDTEIITPCGACRQVVYEFGRDILVIMLDGKKNIKEEKISVLLPEAFDKIGKRINFRKAD